MSLPRIVHTTGHIYHIFNRSVADENIFNSKRNLCKFLLMVDYYRFHQTIRFSLFEKMTSDEKQKYICSIRKNKAVIEIYAYCIMPNHFHFLVKQLYSNGISEFISNIQNSFCRNYNILNERKGALFLHSFKTKLIKNESGLLHLCRYIHLNPLTSYLFDFDKLSASPATSFSIYLNKMKDIFIDTKLILGYFSSIDSFIRFHRSQIEVQRQLKKISKLMKKDL